MLSGETAVGSDPANVVRTMARLAARADANFDYEAWALKVAQLRRESASPDDSLDRRLTDTMTGVTWRAATELGANAIVAISRSGFTVRAIARFRPTANILGFSPDERTLHQLSISWGCTPMPLSHVGNNDAMVAEAVEVGKAQGHLRPGDVVMVLAGTDARSKAPDVLRVVSVP
jgi:pyruvate kinase